MDKAREIIREIILETLNKKDIIITLPSTIKWSEYQKEIEAVKDGSQVMNFKVGNFPKETAVGCKCYVCHCGSIVGYMKIVGMNEQNFTCSTTGKEWFGNFIQRSGPFTYLETKIPMKGFQGFRYFN